MKIIVRERNSLVVSLFFCIYMKKNCNEKSYINRGKTKTTNG